jgi:hypothetical protein
LFSDELWEASDKWLTQPLGRKLGLTVTDRSAAGESPCSPPSRCR